MTRLVRILLIVAGVVLVASGRSEAQINTGSVTGTVSDNTGGVLPGVTVALSGASLIGGVQIEVTDVAGGYRFDRLPPGSYDVKFELAGFKSVDRRGIRVSATFTATVNVQLEVGQIEETITVTGESPVVDTKSNVQQTVMSQEILEGVPTGRDVWSMAKIIPGVNVGAYDVGGTQGMQQSGLSAHGSRGADNTYAIDGLSVNWPGTGGGATMLYYDQGMFEEVNYQTSAIPAEVAIGGVFMNMVTKAGGNAWKGEARYYYANDHLQSENFDEVSKQYNFPGGNPVTEQYDFNGTLAGPIMKDRIWFFGSYRRWMVNKILLSSFNLDGTNSIDDNMIWNGSGKVTAQLNASHRLGVLYNYNQKNRYHRRDATFQDDKSTTLQLQPGYTYQVKYTAVLGGKSVYESTVGLMSGTWPLAYQKEVTPTDLRRTDSVLGTAWGAAARDYRNPNYRFQFDNVLSHTRTGWGGSHNFKAGVQFTRQYYRDVNRVNGDMRLVYNNGVAFRVVATNTPVVATSFIHQLGFFGQDSWSIGRRLTLNLGFRLDGAKGWYPSEASPAGRWVPERRINETEVYNQWIGVWRAGVVYDLFGDGRTALKGNFSRYAAQVGAAAIVNSVHPFALSTANISWTDRNRNDYPDPDELGTFEGFTGGATTRYPDASGTDWSYSDEITAGIEHQIIKEVRVGVMYYHRTNRKDITTENVAVPSSAYTPVDVANPLGGTITIYNLDRAYVGLQANQRHSTDLLDTEYNGIEVTAARRFSNRWQMLFGLTIGKNEGGLNGGLNDPNNQIFRNGIVGNDATHSLKLSGSYLVPLGDILVSGSMIRSTGYPRQISYQVTRSVVPNLVRSAQTIPVNERGELRLPEVMMIDLRFSRPFRLPGGRTIEPQMDVFNITNSNAIVSMVNDIGPRLGYPSEILAPRIVRVGFLLRF